jgi:hypothetical protein
MLRCLLLQSLIVVLGLGLGHVALVTVYLCRRFCMIWTEMQVVDCRDLRRIKWLVPALFVETGMSD